MKKGSIERTTASVNFRSITTHYDFIVWANRVNEAYGKEHLCDLQDVFARSEFDVLKTWFIDDEANRRLLLFAIYKCMGDDKFWEFVNCHVRHQANGKIEQWEREIDQRNIIKMAGVLKREDEVGTREKVLEEGKRAIYRKIKTLKDANEQLKQSLRMKKDLIQKLLVKIDDQDRLNQKAAKWDRIKALLAE